MWDFGSGSLAGAQGKHRVLQPLQGCCYPQRSLFATVLGFLSDKWPSPPCSSRVWVSQCILVSVYKKRLRRGLWLGIPVNGPWPSSFSRIGNCVTSDRGFAALLLRGAKRSRESAIIHSALPSKGRVLCARPSSLWENTPGDRSAGSHSACMGDAHGPQRPGMLRAPIGSGVGRSGKNSTGRPLPQQLRKQEIYS